MNRNNLSRLGCNGFSLVELMLVVGIMSIVMFGLMQLMQTASSRTKSLELTIALDQTMAEIQMVLRNPATCGGNVVNFSPNIFNPGVATSVIPIQKISAPTRDIVTNNQPMSNAPGTTVSINFENFYSIGAGNYVADLAVTLDKGINSLGGKVIKRRIPLSLTTSGVAPNLAISGCNAMAVNTGSTVAYGSCPAGSLMSGFNSTGAECRVVTAPISPTTLASFTPTNPGLGCSGTSCVTHDYGPCAGVSCVTNGSSCTGTACCAGPTCPGL